MNTVYLMMLGALLLLAVFDLIVGVSNDAANFLNSAVGCRAARRGVVLAVAAVGVVLGTSFSGGMMEIARSGVFVPGEFYFQDIMVMFLAVTLADVILLDTFNSFGLPTSTTVSLVFELLGAALAGALYTMGAHGGVPQEVAAYINSSKALTIISGIFVSVLVAFTCGCVTMWIARLIFSFRYQRVYTAAGPFWCALSLTAITYFAVFKGLKHSTLMPADVLALLNAHLAEATCIALCTWYVIAAALQYLFRVNTLRLTVLAGTGALALAFAGNDLVNFIGVFMAAKSSYGIAEAHVAAGGDLSTLKMGALALPVQAEMLFLVGSGLVMVAALCFSEKARNVTETGVKLARAGAVGREKFGSCLTARALVRGAMNLARVAERLTPAPVARFIGRRFEPLSPEEENDADFDLVRGSVTLTIAALLISLATSLKLPLSTTYVTFMVAMGASLADRAWGRDSAVYRITGVLTVVGGWFLTGIAACTAAFVTAAVMLWGGFAGIVVMAILAALILIRSSLSHKKKKPHEVRILDLSDHRTMQLVGESSALFLGRSLSLYSSTVKSLLDEDLATLKILRKKAREIARSQRDMKEDEVLPSLHGLSPELAAQGQLLFRINESCIGIAESLLSIVKAGYRHIDNNHTGLTPAQAHDLLEMTDKLGTFFPGIIGILRSGDFSHVAEVLKEAGDLRDEFGACISRHIVREVGDESNIRTSILYLNLLNETRSMMRKAFNLLHDQQELFES